MSVLDAARGKSSSVDDCDSEAVKRQGENDSGSVNSSSLA